jgi:hypothetical protein
LVGSSKSASLVNPKDIWLGMCWKTLTRGKSTHKV